MMSVNFYRDYISSQTYSDNGHNLRPILQLLLDCPMLEMKNKCMTWKQICFVSNNNRTIGNIYITYLHGTFVHS